LNWSEPDDDEKKKPSTTKFRQAKIFGNEVTMISCLLVCLSCDTDVMSTVKRDNIKTQETKSTSTITSKKMRLTLPFKSILCLSIGVADCQYREGEFSLEVEVLMRCLASDAAARVCSKTNMVESGT
jgi:hypothetical protein